MNNLSNFYNLTTTELSAAIIAFNILLTFVLCLAVVWVYKRTHRGLSYSQSFLMTLVMIGILGSVAMMIVQQNLVGAFALLGTFSLIRFRTIIKDTKDVGFVFFALIEGVAVGTSNYTIAVVTIVLVSGILFLMHHLRLGEIIRSGYILMIRSSNVLDDIKLKSIFRNQADHHHYLHIRNVEGEHEYSFALRLKKKGNPEDFLKEVRQLDHILSVDLMTGKESVEY
jgi:membrane-associated HD superfamily phosphohydrolase